MFSFQIEQYQSVKQSKKNYLWNSLCLHRISNIYLYIFLHNRIANLDILPHRNLLHLLFQDSQNPHHIASHLVGTKKIKNVILRAGEYKEILTYSFHNFFRWKKMFEV